MNMCFISTKWRFCRIVCAKIDKPRWNGAYQRHRKTFIQSFDAFVSRDFEYVFDKEISEAKGFKWKFLENSLPSFSIKCFYCVFWFRWLETGFDNLWLGKIDKWSIRTSRGLVRVAPTAPPSPPATPHTNPGTVSDIHQTTLNSEIILWNALDK